jgi:hypothetical protein
LERVVSDNFDSRLMKRMLDHVDELPAVLNQAIPKNTELNKLQTGTEELFGSGGSGQGIFKMLKNAMQFLRDSGW